jgi:hypothetical protein
MVYSKRGYEFSFAWIFTIFVGATIIFLAIYFAIQIVGTQQAGRDTTEGKSLGVLLTPIETEIEEGKFATVYLTDPTRIYFECETPAPGNQFGSQNLRLSIKPPLGNDWNDSNPATLTFHNKYFFSAGEKIGINEVISEGEEEFYVLSKPLYLPFKVADLMIIYPDREQYCVLASGAPPDFIDRLRRIDMTNVFISPACPASPHKTICFGAGSCNVNIYPTFVHKGDQDIQYLTLTDPRHDPYTMLYAAIFSDPDTYNCQVKRLMAHASKLTDIYSKKAGFCNGPAAQNALQSFNNKLLSVPASGTIQFDELRNFINDPNPNSEFNYLKDFAGGSCELF